MIPLMATIKFTTESSIWTVDPEGLIFSRVPRTEDPRHPSLSYDLIGHPQSFRSAEVIFDSFHGIRRLEIVMTDGILAMSGAIVEGPAEFSTL